MYSSSRPSLKFMTLALGAAVCLTIGLTACGKNKGKVYFGNLKDGAEVESPFTVEMKAENLIVEPATNGVREAHGHFHILTDVEIPRSMDPIPKDAQHIHYGQGQSEATLDLPVGEHTLVLQFAKGDHRPYDPQISQTIHITVTKSTVPSVGEGAASGVTSSNESGTEGSTAATDSTGKVVQEGAGIGGGVGAGMSGGSGSSTGGSVGTGSP